MSEHSVSVRFQCGPDDLTSLHDLVRHLEAAIDDVGVGQFDGKDLPTDGSTGYLYMIGPEADELFRVVRPILEAAPYMHGAVAQLRYGPPRANILERKITLIARPQLARR